MSTPKPLGRETLDEQTLKTDRKKAKKYDQCGLGEKAIYMGGRVLPRQFYVPYESVTHVFKRVAVSKGTGKAFLTPVLYIVVRYDDGQEKQCYFRYLKEADDMLSELEKTHPSISLVSPKSEIELAEKKRREEILDNTVLEGEAAHAVRKLEEAEEILHKRPGLYKDLAGRARNKRTCDLIKPGFQILAAAILIVGILLVAGGIFGAMTGAVSKITALMMILIGAAGIFMMINSKILPTPRRNRRSADKYYRKAVDLMQHHINSYPKFALPARYAHPVVCEMMIRILKEKRAENLDQALDVLKADLKSMDSSVQLQRDVYQKVVTIKPLFTVCEYK